MRRVLSEGLGVDVDGEFEVERAHRSLAPVPNDGQPPRPVLIRFLQQSARDKAVKVARERRGIEWEGIRLSLFPDMTQELAEKRKTHNREESAAAAQCEIHTGSSSVPVIHMEGEEPNLHKIFN